MPPATALMDDVVVEILLRLPPDEPGCLVRACLVSKPWRRLLTGNAFLRSYRKFHGAPPMLGFLHRLYDEDPCVARFVPTAKSFRPPRTDRRCWYALDARHGRALFYDSESEQKPAEFVVWDPVTDGHRRIPLPETPKSWNAAVLCAVDGCDHLDCHGDDPFLVAFVGTDKEEGIWITSACFYSSEASSWSSTSFVEHPDASIEMQPSALSGNAVYFLCDPSTRILQCDFVGERKLSVIDRPDVHENNIVLITAEDGTLGFAGVQESSIYLWSMEVDPDGAAAWVQHRVVDLGKLLTSRALMITPDVSGFAEGVGVIFVRTIVGLFTIELKSGRVRKVSSRGSVCTAIPYTSFYTPDRAIRQLNASDDALIHLST
ncbi:unnamed protein product [Triticum turgidum subsp. durum]|uniref:F-box domain-containing protein n=1 Tax=Triticum turgidum subsp. durum TaxID=4567 RepID=A0A9R1NUA6_TRITD|nr:unnamed protein product [Triticum turgidum subsp. durum]